LGNEAAPWNLGRFPYLCTIVAKIFVILLTFIYTLSATGASVHLHYCCGEIQKLAMQQAPEKPAHSDCSFCVTEHKQEKDNPTCCTDDRDDGCTNNLAKSGHCQDVKVEAKKTTEEHLPTADKKSTKIYPLELLVFTLAYMADLPLDTPVIQTSDAGPPNVAVPLFIQHCTYRI
jgi:hypothetical protein